MHNALDASLEIRAEGEHLAAVAEGRKGRLQHGLEIVVGKVAYQALDVLPDPQYSLADRAELRQIPEFPGLVDDAENLGERNG